MRAIPQRLEERGAIDVILILQVERELARGSSRDAVSEVIGAGELRAEGNFSPGNFCARAELPDGVGKSDEV